MNNMEEYGPLAFFIGQWSSGEKCTGENQAPDPERNVENTKFRQETSFKPIGEVNNHEQSLFALEYKTIAWEEGNLDDPFHQEVGYWLWDKVNQQIIKSFIVPRGISVNAGGTMKDTDTSFSLQANLGSSTYGICSNIFLDKEFQTVSYHLEIKKINDNQFSYDENTRIKIKNQDKIFDHTEKNTMQRLT